jgi:hypothetical protein
MIAITSVLLFVIVVVGGLRLADTWGRLAFKPEVFGVVLEIIC